MCGRVASRHSAGALQRVLGVETITNEEAYRPGYNMGPGRYVPVVRRSRRGKSSSKQTDSKSVLHMMKWGLVPSYSKSPQDSKFAMINARLEGLSASGAYRRLLKTKRCVVVVDGFYEWEKLERNQKQPYFIYTGKTPEIGEETKGDTSAGDLLHLAALYDVWRGDSGEEIYSVSIITTSSRNKFAKIHNRVPVALIGGDVSKWLDCEHVPFENASRVLQAKDVLKWYKVSDYVGSVKNKKAECMEPLAVVMKRRRENGIGKFFRANAKKTPKKKLVTKNEDKETLLAKNNSKMEEQGNKDSKVKDESKTKEEHNVDMLKVKSISEGRKMEPKIVKNEPSAKTGVIAKSSPSQNRKRKITSKSPNNSDKKKKKTLFAYFKKKV